MRKPVTVALALLALVLGLSALAAADKTKEVAAAASWKGEIVDISCYAPRAAHGSGHADCAKKCLKSGQPMGLLTGDGDMVLLVADHDNGKPFEAAKDMAGTNVEVTGTMAEKGGLKVVTITGIKPAA
ncbi:MAG TPA: hypothetical protein VGV61_05315 [Thermoanaerobaculia bacterium]|jgi:hypothetical protein|nr:hypothetical protein [Thermoanaerobaculia bacterium]